MNSCHLIKWQRDGSMTWPAQHIQWVVYMNRIHSSVCEVVHTCKRLHQRIKFFFSTNIAKDQEPTTLAKWIRNHLTLSILINSYSDFFFLPFIPSRYILRFQVFNKFFTLLIEPINKNWSTSKQKLLSVRPSYKCIYSSGIIFIRKLVITYERIQCYT